MPPADRRSVLRALGAVGLAGIAGCGGDGGTEPNRTGSETADTSLGGDTPTENTPTTDGTPTTDTQGTPTVSALTTSARRVVTDMAAGEFEQARASFSEQLASQVSTDQLATVWDQLTAGRGPFVAVVNTEYSTVQGFDVVAVTARFTRGQRVLNVVFDGDGRVAGLRAPPEGAAQSWDPPGYADQSAFTERDLTLTATADCSLGATFTLPSGGGTVPGVVLVHGSGPADRDSTIGPNRPFRDLAWGLASRGVAVLRYEKRTAACQVDPTTITIDDEVTADALTAIDRLGNSDRVAADDVVVLGHSLGGLLAPRIADRDGGLAGICMLAAPARSLSSLVLAQTEYLVNRDGTVTDAEQSRLVTVSNQVERVQSLDISSGETVLGAGRPYWRSLAAYDQRSVADSLSIPRYLLQGAMDYQVTVEGDLARWRETLGEDASVTFQLYEGLNHLFMPTDERGPSSYFRPDHVAQRVVVDLAAWIHRVTGDE